MPVLPVSIIGPTGATDAQSKAISDLSNLGTTIVTETGNLARCIGKIVGTATEDAVGLVIGDPLHNLRSLAAGWYEIKVAEILARRKAKTQPVSLSVALPLIRAAYDETREGLRDFWAALIAAAMDPTRTDRMRISFIDTLRQFDPLDALVLKARCDVAQGDLKPSPAEFLSHTLCLGLDELMISVENLRRLNCVKCFNVDVNFHVTRYGSSLVRACSD